MKNFICAIVTTLCLAGSVFGQYRQRQTFNQYNQYNRFRIVAPTYVYPLPATYYYNQYLYNQLQWQAWQQQYWQMQYNPYGYYPYYGYQGVPQIFIPQTIR